MMGNDERDALECLHRHKFASTPLSTTHFATSLSRVLGRRVSTRQARRWLDEQAVTKSMFPDALFRREGDGSRLLYIHIELPEHGVTESEDRLLERIIDCDRSILLETDDNISEVEALKLQSMREKGLVEYVHRRLPDGNPAPGGWRITPRGECSYSLDSKVRRA